MLIVFVTTPTETEAETLARRIVEEKLAACVQILPEMTSVYVWKGDVEQERERLMLIKTADERYDELEAFIKANHSYDVPEIVAVGAEKISKGYFDWMSEVLER
ncbi:MAG TPA: divalent-cation tolerance protein CutA [Pyrinomonadaceae bacterium]|nr:divalent-cation tolerance protein CutA [Pyrinomonadaceae bacterium]